MADAGLRHYHGYLPRYLNGIPQPKGRRSSFGLDNFTDADIAALAAAADPVSQSLSASAVFDNFAVRDGLVGDYDIDGDVDLADYTRWRTTCGNTVSPAGNLADGNRNGKVDAADFVVWRDNLGATISSGAAVGGSVAPEPTSGILLVAALPFMFFMNLRPSRRALDR